MGNENNQISGPSNLQKARGNKTIRLIVITVLILIAVYMLYSVW